VREKEIVFVLSAVMKWSGKIILKGKRKKNTYLQQSSEKKMKKEGT
jgi:hypothetical protein